MIVVAMKALTWGTVATAVVSALLLTQGGGMLRATHDDDARAARSTAAPAAAATPARDADSTQGKATGASPRQ